MSLYFTKINSNHLMPPRRKKITAPKRTLQPLAQNICWIESDAYDRRAYGNLRSEASSLRALEENGSTFIPHFPSLLQDLFCLFFKNNIIFMRELTLLDEAKSGLCALLLGEALLSLLKSEKVLTRRDMLDLWDIQKQEEILEEKRAEMAETEKISEEQLSDEVKKLL